MQRYYSSEKLIQVTRHRGYYNIRAVAQALSQNTDKSLATWRTKIGSGNFSREEMIFIASYFEMTPKEFCDVFLHGLFNENELGHFVAHVESPQELFEKRKPKQKDIEDILSQIDAL